MGWEDICIVVRSRTNEVSMAIQTVAAINIVTKTIPHIVYNDNKKLSLLEIIDYGMASNKEWLLVVENDCVLGTYFFDFPETLNSEIMDIVCLFSIDDTDLARLVRAHTQDDLPFLISYGQRIKLIKHLQRQQCNSNKFVWPCFNGGVSYAINMQNDNVNYIEEVLSNNNGLTETAPVAFLLDHCVKDFNKQYKLYYCVPSLVQHNGILKSTSYIAVE